MFREDGVYLESKTIHCTDTSLTLFSHSLDGPPVTNRVDGAAEVLGVHVRRIYELIKILEILSLVTVSVFGHY